MSSGSDSTLEKVLNVDKFKSHLYRSEIGNYGGVQNLWTSPFEQWEGSGGMTVSNVHINKRNREKGGEVEYKEWKVGEAGREAGCLETEEFPGTNSHPSEGEELVTLAGQLGDL